MTTALLFRKCKTTMDIYAKVQYNKLKKISDEKQRVLIRLKGSLLCSEVPQAIRSADRPTMFRYILLHSRTVVRGCFLFCDTQEEIGRLLFTENTWYILLPGAMILRKDR